MCSKYSIPFMRKSFWLGMARVLDIGCTLRKCQFTGSHPEQDWEKIALSWKKVGADIWTAVNKYETIKPTTSK